MRPFLLETWSPDHPTCHRDFYKWQFKGFGVKPEKISSIILFDGDELIGCRGIIPGLYQIPGSNGVTITDGGSFAMWMIREGYRGQKLGLEMHRAAEEILPVISGAGSNQNSVSIHLKNGFCLKEAMWRYVTPLSSKGYVHLLISKRPEREVKEWIASTDRSGASPIHPTPIDPILCARAWEQVSFPMGLISLYRNEDFWRWRYLDSPGFKYLFFGDAESIGFVIARLETVMAPEDESADKLKVLRIIELVPSRQQIWGGSRDMEFSRFLAGVLEWARQENCVAADFNCSASRFTPVMEQSGFRLQDFSKDDELSSLRIRFQPHRSEARPINALYRILDDEGHPQRVDFESTYMVKSENDMDRPGQLQLSI